MRIRAALGQGGAAPIRSEPDGPCRVSRGGNLCSDPSPISVPGTLGARTLESQVPSGALPQTGAEISLNTSIHRQTERSGEVAAGGLCAIHRERRYWWRVRS